MRRQYRLRWLLRLAVVAVAAWTPLSGRAADVAKGFSPVDPNSDTVDVFDAVQRGQITLQLIAKDAHHARLLVANHTDKPLNVRLPDVLAGAPVLAQFPNFPNAAPGNNRRGQNQNAPQALGLPIGPGMNAGPMGNNNPMMNLPNQGNGPFNRRPLFCIAPDAVGQLKISSLCLEFGKPNPKASTTYEVRPIESVAPKAEVQEVVRMLAQGTLSQRAAQAAVWRLNNDVSWEKLESLPQDGSKFVLVHQPWFRPQDLAEAKKAVESAAQRLKQRETAASSQASLAR